MPRVPPVTTATRAIAHSRFFARRSDAALLFYYQNPRRSDRMGDMFVTRLGGHDVARAEMLHPLGDAFAIMHLHRAIEHDKDFAAVIDVPFVRLVGPMQAHAGTLDLGDIARVPGFGRGEILRVEMKSHVRRLALHKGYIGAFHYRSTHMAMPMPPPMQSVASPFLAPRLPISCSRVTSTRAPEAPMGWPMAMAPPLTFTLA